MIEKEEKARQHFEELKGVLQMFSPHWWKKNFKHHVDEFIGDRLIEKELRCNTMQKQREGGK